MIGIYIISNKLDGRAYLGCPSDVTHRLHTHRSKLRRDKHHCKDLQKAWNADGEDSFIMMILEEVSVDELVNSEQAYLDGLGCLYNTSGTAMRTKYSGLSVQLRNNFPGNLKRKKLLAYRRKKNV